VAVSVFKFGDFKLDCDRFELYRGGRTLKLERKPMELLVLLAAKNGHLVTRAEIAEHLWDREVFVDTEHGINTAIRKIREVLQDDPAKSRFVQTVTGKGYRFIGSVIEIPQSPVENQSISDTNTVPAPPGPVPASDDAESARARNSLRGWLYPVGTAAAFALMILIVSLGARGFRARSINRATPPKISSLAVLPLDNLSGDPGQNYFADGMTDELTTMLAKNSTLRIVSRTSVMQYKGAHRPLPQIARELGVDGILEGSIARSDGKVHMTIQLIQASSDTHVWAESYDREANDVVSLPREAAETIAKKLNSAALQPNPVRYVNPEAHDAYLRGRYLWFMEKNEEAGKYFRKATELQPDYALGWSGLSTYYGVGAIEGIMSPGEALKQEEAMARKAVELDDSLPEAHLSLGAAIFMNRWDWQQADQELARAIELNPRYAEAYHFRSKIYAALNRTEETIEAEKKATELDPFERPFAMALAYLSVRQYDAAINAARQRLETLPQDLSLHWDLYEAYRRKGAEKESAQELEKLMLLSGSRESAANVRHAFEQGGDKAVIHWQLDNLKQKSATHYVSPVSQAFLYARLGRRAETLALLEEGCRQHSPLLLWIQNDPAFDFLHSDERYRAIIQQIGLPPAY
jgi:TolB-like protein/DNA-binding winged helix-turn-helix (wHTH) protein